MTNPHHATLDQAWGCVERNELWAIDGLITGLNPDYASTQNLRAVVLMRQGKYQDAIEILRPIVLPNDRTSLDESTDPAIQANFALALLLNENQDGFLEFIDQLPKDHTACMALHSVHDGWQEARKKQGWLKKAFGSTPPLTVPNDMPRGWRESFGGPSQTIRAHQSPVAAAHLVNSGPLAAIATPSSTPRPTANERKPRTANTIAPTDKREIRIFISSTFRDMMRERDLLVKEVFPALRRICARRFVTFTEVDLRWGITEEQAAEGKVLPLCLAEIERSRPYFLGLLGERYGWIPDTIPPEVIEREPWLKEHVTDRKSVTELEILHGVLNNPEMQGHTFFYFRDPEYVNNPQLKKEDRREMVERDIPAEVKKYGQVEASRRTAERKEKLSTLKQRIRDSKLPLVEPYATPEELSKIIEKQFEDLINKIYPEQAVPDPLDRERLIHEAHARNKLFACIDRPDHLAALTAFADQTEHDGKGLVVTGESGSGKSALLAAWAGDRAKSHPDELIFQHYFGATPESASPESFLHRLFGELKKEYDITEDVPSQPDKLREALPLWLAHTINRGRLILILDGLNQVQGPDPDKRLNFLPRYFPPNVFAVASALPGPALDALLERHWATYELPLADAGEIDAMVGEYFKQIGRHLDEKGVPLQTGLRRQLVAAAGSKNPLFLRTVLEELRQFGSFEKLPDQVRNYLEAKDPKELFIRVIRRWQSDFESKGPGGKAQSNLVERVVTRLWAARQGLSEPEWLDLLGSADTPLPRAHWTPFFLSLEPHLSQSEGLFVFGHAFIRQAVEELFLPSPVHQKRAHITLADYFENHPHQQTMTSRKAAEWPYQIFSAESWQRLEKCLTDIPLFLVLCNEENKWELTGYWHPLRKQGRDMGKCYIDAYSGWSKPNDGSQESHYVSHQLGTFLMSNGELMAAEPLFKYAIAGFERVLGPEHPDTINSINNLALLFEWKGDYKEAQSLFERALIMSEQVLGPEHLKTPTIVNNLAMLFERKGDYSAAQQLLERALVSFERVLGPIHSSTLTIINNLAILLKRKGDYSAAQPLFVRVLEAMERVLGPEHPDTFMIFHNLATLLDSIGDYAAAQSMHERALEAMERVLGPEHPNTLNSVNSLAELLRRIGDYAAAQSMLERALAFRERVLGPEHPDTLTSVNNLALLLDNKGDYAAAQPLYERALALRERVLGPEHPDTLSSVNNLGSFLESKGDFASAQPLLERTLAFRERELGLEHPDTLSSVNNLATLLGNKGDFAGAQLLLERALVLRERVLGLEHPDSINSVNNLAMLFERKGDFSSAQSLYRQALEARESVLGPEHPDTLYTVISLAGLHCRKSQYDDAKFLYERALEGLMKISRNIGIAHPNLEITINFYATCLNRLGYSQEQIINSLRERAPELCVGVKNT